MNNCHLVPRLDGLTAELHRGTTMRMSGHNNDVNKETMNVVEYCFMRSRIVLLNNMFGLEALIASVWEN